MRVIRLSAAAVVMAAAAVVGVTAASAGAATAPASSPAHVYATRVVDVAIPVTHEVHSSFKITGIVQAKTGSAWTAAPSVTVGVYATTPKGKWVKTGSTRTTSKGAFSWAVSGLVKFGHLVWQLRVATQQVGSTEYKWSNSPVKPSFWADRTYVTHFVAMHIDGDTSLGAIIQDYPASGGVTYENVSGVAKFYWRPAGGKTWDYLGSSHTSSFGSVEVEPAGTLDGTFQIVFPAQGIFLASNAEQSLG
jgi:hypothetical protein